MQAQGGVILLVEPDTRICTTVRITSELYSCSENNYKCNYGLYAGKTCTYCLHPDHLTFRRQSALRA